MRIVLLCAFTALCFFSAAQADDVNAIVDAERSFSKASVEKGRKQAFLTYLADDSILFRPEPMPGKKLVQEQPDASYVLIWEPAFVEIAASGDFGYSTGPWIIKQKLQDEKPSAHGQFFSIWKKQPDGNWRVIADTGISHDPPDSPAVLKTVKPDPSTSSKIDPAKLKTEVLSADRSFSKLSAEKGSAEAYKQFHASQIRVLRNGMFPQTDSTAAMKVFSAMKGTITWQPTDGEAASSGDLAFTYGNYELTQDGASEKGSYLRVWKKQADGSWKITADVLNQPPPKQ